VRDALNPSPWAELLCEYKQDLRKNGGCAMRTITRADATLVRMAHPTFSVLRKPEQK
jgi:hypothetical protein